MENLFGKLRVFDLFDTAFTFETFADPAMTIMVYAKKINTVVATCIIEFFIGLSHTLRLLKQGQTLWMFSIPEFDRGPSDPSNLLVVILGKINSPVRLDAERVERQINKTTADSDLVSRKVLSPKEVSESCC